MSKVWFVTGAARGMGNAIVNAVLQHGDCVVATSRKGDDIRIPDEYKENTLCLKLDISDGNAEIYAEAVDKAVARFGRIDVLVNNTGYGAVIFFEETKEEGVGEDAPDVMYGFAEKIKADTDAWREIASDTSFEN